MGTPMVDDLELAAVQWLRQETEQGFARQRVAGLDGVVHQKVGRHSHRVVVSGVLLPATATDDLATLQEKASSGVEVTFAADITTALEVDKMVIESFAAEQVPGNAGQFAYTLVLAESPPLPPPAEISPFGGLDDLGGLGDLGFDDLAGALDDIAGAAGAITDTLDAAMDAVAAVQGLAALAGGLGDLANLSDPLKPITDKLNELGSLPDMLGALPGLLDGLGG
jgi:phage protein U